MFLVLQGSGTYLWQFLKAPDRPIFRTDFLAMIDDALAAYCIDGDKEVRTRGIACGDYCPRTGVQICKTLHIWMSTFSDANHVRRMNS
jgi:hypothetical protein